MALWAGNHVLGRWANGLIPPMTLSFLRWLAAAVLILPFAWPSIRRDWTVIRANVPILLVLGFMGAGIYNTLQYLALTETTATNAAILNSWGPVVILLTGTLAFGDKLGLHHFSGMALALTGVAVVMLKGELDQLSEIAFNRGDLVMVFATAVWAVYTSLMRLRPAISTLSFIGLTYTIAAFVNLPLATFEYVNGQMVQWSAETAAAVAYAAVFASLVAYWCYAYAVEVIGSNRTGAFIHLIPLFTSALAVLLLGEQPALYHAAGFGLILSGVIIANR
jgi:drug/metabolite transporter (DMT)-like permease